MPQTNLWYHKEETLEQSETHKNLGTSKLIVITGLGLQSKISQGRPWGHFEYQICMLLCKFFFSSKFNEEMLACA